MASLKIVHTLLSFFFIKYIYTSDSFFQPFSNFFIINQKQIRKYYSYIIISSKWINSKFFRPLIYIFLFAYICVCVVYLLSSYL